MSKLQEILEKEIKLVGLKIPEEIAAYSGKIPENYRNKMCGINDCSVFDFCPEDCGVDCGCGDLHGTPCPGY